MSSRALLAKASDPATAPARLHELSGDRDKQIRAAVAANPSTPVETLELLATDRHPVVRGSVSKNPAPHAWSIALRSDAHTRVVLTQRQDLDEQTLQALLTDDDWKVREGLAASTRSPDVLHRLARDENQHPRAWAALNRALPSEDHELLAHDRIAQVRAAAAQRPGLRDETVLKLARDRSAFVRYEVLRQYPGLVASLLIADPDELVADLAQELQDTPR